MKNFVKSAVVIGTIILVFSISLALILLIFYFFLPSFSRKANAPSNTYQYVEINPKNTTKTKYGLVNLPQELTPSEYISYTNHETNHLFFISHIGTTEYECVGTCTCGNKDDPTRRHAGVLTRGVSLIITALSAIVATQIAREVFQEQCNEVRTEICDDWFPDKEEEIVDKDIFECTQRFVDDVSKETFQYRVDKRYFCKGHCLKSEFLDDVVHLSKYSSKTMDEVMMHLDEFGDCTHLKSAGYTYATSLVEAQIRFVNMILDEFCRAITEKIFDCYNPETLKKKPIYYDFNVCVGGGMSSFDDRDYNDYIFCVRDDP